jgi:hypothetical protein
LDGSKKREQSAVVAACHYSHNMHCPLLWITEPSGIYGIRAFEGLMMIPFINKLSQIWDINTFLNEIIGIMNHVCCQKTYGCTLARFLDSTALVGSTLWGGIE